MQDQGKRLMVAVGLALVVMLGWQMIFKPKDEPKPQDQPGSAVPTAPAPTPSKFGESANQPTAPAAPSPSVTAPVQPAEPVLGPEQTITLTYPAFHATFSSYGGILKSWQLSDSRYQRDETKGELLPPEGAFILNFWDSSYSLPAKTEWKGEQLAPNRVRYEYKSDLFDIAKDYEIDPAAFVVKLKVTVVMNLPAGTEAKQELALRSYQDQDPAKAGGGSSRVAARVWSSSTMRDGKIVSTEIKDLIESPRKEADITWTGFEHPYLLVGFSPKPAPSQSVEKHSRATPTGLMSTDMVFLPAAPFKAGDHTPSTREIVSYFGPKNYNQLEHADAVAGFSTGFKQTVDLGWFSFIGQPLLWLLLKFHELIGNWGLSIVLLTFLVKGITLYWTTKSMRSMKAMAALGPQMKALQGKYKDDKQRLQLETMAMYKQYGVNPLSGCLPILLQMPIWLALYRMLSSAGELYQQPFIPGWIDDLTASDPYYVLPVILVVTMFVQARLQPMSPDPSQKMQQNLMKWGMPLMFGVMSFFFPAGLTLYIFTNTILSAVHSIYMNKYDKKSLELTAMMKKKAEAAAKTEVKNAKDANPKDAGKAKAEAARAITSGDDDDAGDAEPAAEDAKPRVRASQRKKKGGRRR